MKCTDIKTLRDGYLDGQLSLEQKQAFELHLVECRTCADSVKGMSSMLAGLKVLPVAESTAGFEQRVFSAVRKQHRKKVSRHFVGGFSTAMAAAAALWFVSTMFIMPQSPLGTVNEITVAMDATQNVRLLFDAPDDLDQVTLSINLPDNMQLSGYPGRSELSWQTSLKKGENVLTLPIMAIDKGQGELIAQLNYGDKVKVFRLVLITADNGVVNYQMQAVSSV